MTMTTGADDGETWGVTIYLGNNGIADFIPGIGGVQGVWFATGLLTH